MRIRLAPNVEAAAQMLGMLLAGFIVVASGLAFFPLILGAWYTTVVALEFTGAGYLTAAWFWCALSLSIWNMAHGLEGVNDPTLRRLGWLYGSSAIILLLGLLVRWISLRLEAM